MLDTLPVSEFITQVSTVKKFGPMTRCIYCRASEYSSSRKKLGDEHIIPEGLGGNLVLQSASCGKCERITGALEQTVLRGHLYAPRLHQKLRRKRRRRTDKLPVVYVDVKDGGKNVPFPVPIDDHPAILFFINYDDPGIIAGRQVSEARDMGAWIRMLNYSQEKLLKYGVTQFATPSIDNYKFCRMLAKIAHAFAVSKVGLDAFSPLLLSFLLEESEEAVNKRNYYVGRDAEEPLPDGDGALHELVLRRQKIDQSDYLVVRIRLFANLGAPAYQVVVGRLNP